MDGPKLARLSLGTALPGGPVVVAAPASPGAPWFDQIYRQAAGDLAKLPWQQRGANAALVSWLNAEAAGRVRPGSRAAVIGCGVGDDVFELLNRGYDALGFDISPAAIDWARSRFPGHENAFLVCDLLAPPPRFRHRFELVAECRTLQSLEPGAREQAAAALVSLVAPRGVLVIVATGRDDADLLEHVHGPPWPLTRSELSDLMEAAGMKPIRAIDDFTDDAGERRLRGVFERA